MSHFVHHRRLDRMGAASLKPPNPHRGLLGASLALAPHVEYANSGALERRLGLQAQRGSRETRVPDTSASFASPT